jgi:hypothetical protein
VRLAIEAALPAAFNSTTDAVLLVGDGLTLVCDDARPESADGQTVSCLPPPLSQRFLGVVFDVCLVRDNVTVATLGNAMRYAWPVLSVVEPSIGLPVSGPAVALVVQSPALVLVLVAWPDVVQPRVWIGTFACVDVTVVSTSSGLIRCLAPAGVGTGVVVTVEQPEAFNVTSTTAVPVGQPMSQYDGQFSFAAAATGAHTTVSFARPYVSAVTPAAVTLLPGADTGRPVAFTLQLSAPLADMAWVTLLLSYGPGSHAAACRSPDASAVSDAVCVITVGELSALLAVQPNQRLVGAVSVSVAALLRVREWPDSTAAIAAGAQSVVVVGLPVVAALNPPVAAEGSRLTISGAALALPGETALATVTVGGALCVDVVATADASLSCTLPSFNATTASEDGTAAVVVHTSVGDSAAAPFRFAMQLHIEWLQGVRGVNEVWQLPGMAPLRPVPAVRISRGAATACWLNIASIQPLDVDAQLQGTTTVFLPNTNSTSIHANVSFPETSAAGTGISEFRASLTVACRDARGLVVAVAAPLVWRFAGFSVQWASSTIAAASAVLAPSEAGLPSVAVIMCLSSAVSATLRSLLVSGHLACSAAVVHGSVVISASAGSAITYDDSARAGCLTAGLAGFDLSAAPFGSTLLLRGSCSWKPTQALIPLQSLTLRTVPVAVSWLQRPPAITESQALLRPAPVVQVKAAVPDTHISEAMWQRPIHCTLTATLVAIADGDGTLQAVDAAGASAAASIVVAQTVAGRWNQTLAFDAFSVAGRRLSRYHATVACTLGQQQLPLLWHELSIAGCDVGQEPGGSTGWLCNNCPPGTYSDGGAMVCRPCPATGASCSSGALQLQPGFFLAVAPTATAGGLRFDAATELHGCFNSEACTLNASSRAYGCFQGYGGPLCGVCQPGYTLFGQTCDTCWPAWGAGLLVAAIAVVLVAAVTWLALFHKPGNRSPASIALRQMVGFLQMLNVVSTFRQQAAGLARNVLGWTDAANASLLSFGPLGCLFPLSFLARFALTLALPVAFGLAVAGLTWLRQHSRFQAVARCCRRGVSVQPPARIATQGAAEVHASASVTERLVSVVLLLTSLLYMPLLSACLRALDCYEQPIAGVTYLRADLRVTCGVGQHSVAVILAWVVLAVLGFGFPAFILGRLCTCEDRCRRRSACSGVPSTSQQTGAVVPTVWRPLYDGYDVRRKTLWWEAAVLLRKAALAIVGTFLGSSSQGVPVLSVVLLISVALQEAVHPYEEPRFNWGERLSLGGALAAALLAGLYRSDGGPGDGRNVPVTAGITAVTMSVTLALALQWLQAARADWSSAAVKARTVLLQLSRKSSARRGPLHVADPRAWPAPLPILQSQAAGDFKQPSAPISTTGARRMY